MKLLVTATDTGVGKTTVACALIRALRAQGRSVAPMKPVETGWDGSAWPDDAGALRDAAGGSWRRDEVVPYAFREALAPAVAASRDGVDIDVATLDRVFRALAARADDVVVEGAGGAAVPVAPGVDFAGLASRWDLEALVVCRPGLGTLNHTVLTVRHLQACGVKVAGLVVNRFPARPGPDAETNLAWLHRLAGVALVGVIPESGSPLEAERAALREMAAWLQASSAPVPSPRA